MNCVLVVETSCCTNNCLKAEIKDSSIEEYEVGSSDEEKEEEDMESVSGKTVF